jgi:hypothetical protein
MQPLDYCIGQLNILKQVNAGEKLMIRGEEFCVSSGNTGNYLSRWVQAIARTATRATGGEATAEAVADRITLIANMIGQSFVQITDVPKQLEVSRVVASVLARREHITAAYADETVKKLKIENALDELGESIKNKKEAAPFGASPSVRV